MCNITLIVTELKRFEREHLNIKNGRYKSWEHCYSCFTEARNNNKLDYDYLSLMLAFYLASWGMYRGSTFLIKRDYLIHEPAVRIILDGKYNTLSGISCTKYKDDPSSIKLLFDLVEELKMYYSGIRIGVKGIKPKGGVSDTLITKILMGTLGCVPAYDRYFVSGAKHIGMPGKFSKNSIKKLAEFYYKNNSKLENVRKGLYMGNKLQYSQMKLIDMGLWQLGVDLRRKKSPKNLNYTNNSNCGSHKIKGKLKRS